MAEPNGDDHQASVALVFRPGPQLLFIRRSEHPNDPWSGHIALPGGRVDPTDIGPRQTAMRETVEEVGIDLKPTQYLGRLNDCVSPIRLHPPKLIISAFVFATNDPKPAIEINHEVAEVFWFDWQRLIDNEGRTTMPYKWKTHDLSLPCVQLDSALIWGLTLHIIDDLLKRVRES